MDELMDLASKETGAMPLSNATLGDLSGAATLPRYDRSRLTPGIIHIGVGNFHRAHLAWYVHRLMQQGDAADWGIIGSGVMENDRNMRQNLLAQDCLTTLIELDPEGGRQPKSSVPCWITFRLRTATSPWSGPWPIPESGLSR